MIQNIKVYEKKEREKKKKKLKMQACVLNVFYGAILIPSINVNGYIKLFEYKSNIQNNSYESVESFPSFARVYGSIWSLLRSFDTNLASLVTVSSLIGDDLFRITVSVAF